MSLRKRTLLVVGLALVGLMLVMYLAAQIILLDSYRLLEEQSTRRNVSRVQDALATMIDTLDSKAGDWANWDGTGYPRRLKGTEIPLAARIFAVLDVWDALCSDRPYRAAWPEERVRTHIQSQSGTHFDPDVVTAFFDQLPRRV